MKIAIFVDSFPVWTETFIVNQITGLIDRGHEIEIYSDHRRTSDSTHSVIDKYNLIGRTHFLSDLPKNRLDRLLYLLAILKKDNQWLSAKTWLIFYRILKSRKKAYLYKINILSMVSIAMKNTNKKPHDILHCQFGNLGPKVLLLKKINVLKGKLVTSFRGHDATQRRYTTTNIYAELFREGNLFMPVSKSLGKKLVSLGCTKDKIQVLHSGINCNKFNFHTRKLHENDQIKLVSIARFVEMKGLEYAIKAVAKLVHAGYNISYTIVGDGDLRPNLEKLIHHLDVNNIHLAGWMNHEKLAKVLENSHILIAPSVTAKNGETEGIPNAVKEAMAMGMPVLSTLHSGIPELVQDKTSGYLVPERDTTALADQLTYLIDNPELWPKLGQAGRLIVESKFDMEKLNDLLVKYYKILVSTN